MNEMTNKKGYLGFATRLIECAVYLREKHQKTSMFYKCFHCDIQDEGIRKEINTFFFDRELKFMSPFSCLWGCCHSNIYYDQIIDLIRVAYRQKNVDMLKREIEEAGLIFEMEAMMTARGFTWETMIKKERK